MLNRTKTILQLSPSSPGEQAGLVTKTYGPFSIGDAKSLQGVAHSQGSFQLDIYQGFGGKYPVKSYSQAIAADAAYTSQTDPAHFNDGGGVVIGPIPAVAPECLVVITNGGAAITNFDLILITSVF
jgi:hypothetical protein